MTSARSWKRVAALIDTALERTLDERARYLDNACGGDAALRAEVEAILAGGHAPSFLDSGALVFAASLLEVLDEEGEGNAAAETSAPSEVLAVIAQERAEDSDLILPDDLAAVTDIPYRLERKVGRGGMAAVYLARDTKHDRHVAVKVLHSSLTARVEAERFVQEIRLTARLQHPHVLGLLDSGVFPPEGRALAGRPYYVMPFVEGESLRALLARGDSLGLREALRLLRDVADALCYAHGQGVIHRDIKPENILMSGGHAVVADFGIAKALFASHTTESGSDAASHTPAGSLRELSTLIGTPAYMAPEQVAADGTVDHRADLYAWGVVAYELLAGRHPFAGKVSANELASAHRDEMPQPLQEAAPALPHALAALVMRCLAKAAAERPSSGAEIVGALDAAMVAAASRHSMRNVSSRRVSLGVLAALGTALVLGAVGAHKYWKGSATPLAVVTGTGDAGVDVPAVQTAIDRADTVILKGVFSFNSLPTKPVAPLLAAGYYPPAAEILVPKAVTISGMRDVNGKMTTIDGGTIPFYVDVHRGSVTIRGLHFVRPITSAVLVHAVRDLEISDCEVERLMQFGDGALVTARGAVAISIDTRGEIPMPASPGNPENVSGHLVIAHNDIDAASGTPDDVRRAGLLVFSVGQSPDREVDLDIIGNRIRNATAGTVNIRRVNGRVRVLGNTLTTSAQAPVGNDAVRLVNTGSYLMANNRIESNQRDGIGIAVFSQFAEWPMEHAVVENNDVTMSALRGAVFGDSSAGINIRGFARNNVVRHNTIRGRARAALSMYEFRGGVPVDNEFTNNRFEDFHAALADIFVGAGVVRGRIVGPGTVAGQGAGATSSR